MASANLRSVGGKRSAVQQEKEIETEHRLTRIETTLPYLATKEDVKEVQGKVDTGFATQKNWLLGIILSTVISLIIAVIAIVNLVK